MSRVAVNPGIVRLLAKASLARGHGEPFVLLDLASLCGCHRSSIHLYATGRKAMPNVERKMAEVFGLTVPQLRRKLGLPQTQRRKS